jgi:hypothetical protein
MIRNNFIRKYGKASKIKLSRRNRRTTIDCIPHHRNEHYRKERSSIWTWLKYRSLKLFGWSLLAMFVLMIIISCSNDSTAGMMLAVCSRRRYHRWSNCQNVIWPIGRLPNFCYLYFGNIEFSEKHIDPTIEGAPSHKSHEVR